MDNLIKRTIAVLMVILMSFSVIAYVGNSDFSVSAASAKTISIKKKPTLKASKIKATTVKLSWSKTKGATSYRVYKSTDKKKWTLITKTKKTSYTVKNLNGNKKYYFKVRAYKNKIKSPYSKVISVKTKKNETLYATTKVTVRKKDSSKSKKLGTLKKGASIKRTATTSKGWSKIIYKGKTAYIKTNCLSTKKTVEKNICLEFNCEKVAVIKDSYCSEHKCANPNCTFKKDYDSQFCSVCTCQEVLCKKAHQPNGFYCVEHTCKANNCYFGRTIGKSYCITHACASCDNIRVSGGFYCQKHTCKKLGCTFVKSPNSEYCTSHQCMAGLCTSVRIDGGMYCQEHTCVVHGCKSQKLLPGSDYCYSHDYYNY